MLVNLSPTSKAIQNGKVKSKIQSQAQKQEPNTQTTLNKAPDNTTLKGGAGDRTQAKNVKVTYGSQGKDGNTARKPKS